jgi:hypothetical protein
VDEEIKTLNEKLKTVRLQKASLSEKLIEIMNSINLCSVETSSGIIKLKNKIQAGPINKEHVESTLEDCFKKRSLSNASDIAQMIFDTREKTEKHILSLQKTK